MGRQVTTTLMVPMLDTDAIG